MRRVVACLLLVLALGSPAAAWDPYWDDWWWEEPAVSYEPEPVDDVWWWQEPAWEPAPPPPPAPAVPPGIYYVTEVYVADIVTVSGPVTTYSTVTLADTPGTYARVADVVVTGASSPFDGAAFNGRSSLDDGRPVAGTYYENFVIANGSFVPVSVVFFQDDAAVASAPAPTPSPPAPTPAPLVLIPAPIPPTGAPATAEPLPTSTPVTVRIPEPVARIDPIAEPTAPPRRIPSIRPGITASPLGDIRFSIEVLRGRLIAVWFRASVDGATVPVSSWRVVSGEHTALGPSSGGPDDAFRARWDVVTRPGGSWILRVEATVLQGGIAHAATGDVLVVVRSPALIR